MERHSSGQKFWRVLLVSKLLDKLGYLNPPFHLSYWRWFRLGILVVADIILISAAYYGAFWLRLDSIWLTGYMGIMLQTLPILVLIHLPIFFWGGMYRQVWRYANFYSAIMVGKCVVISTALFVTACSLMVVQPPIPRSVFIIYALVGTSLIAFVRFSWRTWTSFQASRLNKAQARCLIYGAGNAGDLLARHIGANPRFPYYAVGFLDDDKNKTGRMIHGLRILGTGRDLGKLCGEYTVSTVILAMPSAPGKLVRDLVAQCQTAGVKPLIMPDMANSLGDGVFQPRAVDVKDLMKRAPKAINHERIQEFFTGKTVLVTGAGGSIGSEICRQVITCGIRNLILLDASELNLYQIELELRDLAVAGVNIQAVLGSTIDKKLVNSVFHEFHPEYVLHAAAYKHVPLIEANPLVGVVNNVLGTKIVAESAVAHACEHFLLISSDKAVRPTNVMGATKRCCELLVQAMYAVNPRGCRFSAVRFGNVLGSSGSVIPRFMQQIQNGGPVTVTHPEVTRYFMLTSEAVGLVLQSITMSQGGETFVLNMGEPVKIYEMAKQLILLAGKEPGKDVEIVFSGLRPGEKLYEELILEGSERHILHDDVYVAVPHPFNPQEICSSIENLIRFGQNYETAACLELLRMLTSSEKCATDLTVQELQSGEHPLH